MTITDQDRIHLRQSVSLAHEALEAGDDPFGSVLVDSTGRVRYTDRNRVNTKADVTWHPEFTIAVWAQTHMTKAERAKATVYTSGEHCVMCAAAHGYAGLGRIVYVSSTEQLLQWKEEFGVESGRVRGVAIKDVLVDCVVDGPDQELVGEVKELQRRRWMGK